MKAIVAIATAMALVLLSGMAVADERMSVSTEKSVYIVGECITITVTNECNEPVQLKGYWIEDSEGARVYAPVLLGFLQYLGPGESFVYYWGQTDYSGNQVPEGFYTVNIEEGSTSVEIVSDTLTLSTSKNVYSSGEDVAISVTNTGDEAVAVPMGYTVINEMGETIYAENTLAFLRILQPGESIEYVWDQTDDLGDAVADGSYTIVSGNDRGDITIVPGNADSDADNGHENTTIDPVADDFTGKRPNPPRKLPNSRF